MGGGRCRWWVLTCAVVHSTQLIADAFVLRAANVLLLSPSKHAGIFPVRQCRVLVRTGELAIARPVTKARARWIPISSEISLESLSSLTSLATDEGKQWFEF